jgi:hypothetical protein
MVSLTCRSSFIWKVSSVLDNNSLESADTRTTHHRGSRCCSADNVLHNLDCRYRKDEIYTSISKVCKLNRLLYRFHSRAVSTELAAPILLAFADSQVLIAVNPYQMIDIYSGRIIQQCVPFSCWLLSVSWAPALSCSLAPRVCPFRYRKLGNKRNVELPPHVFSVSQAGEFPPLPRGRSVAVLTAISGAAQRSTACCRRKRTNR